MEDYEDWKQNANWYWIQMWNERKWQPEFQIHIVAKSCSSRELGQPFVICCTVHLWKMMRCMLFWSVQTFCEWQIHRTLPLSCVTITALSFVFDACACHVFLSLTGTPQGHHYSGASFAVFPFWAKLLAPYTPKSLCSAEIMVSREWLMKNITQTSNHTGFNGIQPNHITWH